MSEKITISDLETEIRILKNSMESCQSGLKRELSYLTNKTMELPSWVKSSAAGLMIAVFTQVVASVWWASSVTNTISNIKDDVATNTNFRTMWPQQQSDILVSLQSIQSRQDYHQAMLEEVKDKLRYVDIKQQHTKPKE